MSLKEQGVAVGICLTSLVLLRLARIGSSFTAVIPRKFAIALLVAGVALASAYGQYRGGRFRGGGGFQIQNEQEQREQDEMAKAIRPGFEEDTFSFARLRFSADRGYGLGSMRSWNDDTPEADLTLGYRIYQTTALKVRPGLHFIDITTNDLRRFPFAYLSAAGRLQLESDEVVALRSYLNSGGFLMVDDFWGDEQWHHFHDEIKRVFPDREPMELPLSHPIFHSVFDLKKLPQIPSVGSFLSYRQSYDPGYPYAEKGHDPHYYGIFDDKQRLMVLICFNNHFGDGWEHETDDHTYFDTFSEPYAYPMFINVAFYAMTH